MNNKPNIQTSKTREGDNVFTLCGTNGCCPTVTINKEGDHVIRDDFGGEVTLSAAQFDLLKEVDC